MSRRTAALIIAALATHVATSGAQGKSDIPESPVARRALLLDVSRNFWKTRAPDTVAMDMETSRGTITLELVRDWAPAGVDRFYNLARAGYYDDTRFYRVLYGFVAQFGVAATPAVTQAWARRNLPPDAPREKNLRGTLAFAQNTPRDRTTNVFINLRDNPSLDTLKFVPFGRVVAGMAWADSLFTLYGEGPTSEAFGGSPKRLYNEANHYLDEKYPNLDRIIKITVRP